MFGLSNNRGRSDRLLARESSFLLAVDVQAKLMPLIANQGEVAWNLKRLVEGARTLAVPQVMTEQYPEKLGGTIPLLGEMQSLAIAKRMFSCRECFAQLDNFRRSQRRQVVLCGIESHVCVLQTALDLIADGWIVFAVADAMGSRAELDHTIALQRLGGESVVLTTTESVLFEWCETSLAPEFRAISSLVKQARPE